MHALPNTTTQFIVREMIGDLDWLENVFMAENLKRLKAARDRCIAQLDALGIRYLKPQIGFFVMLDLRQVKSFSKREHEHKSHIHFSSISTSQTSTLKDDYTRVLSRIAFFSASLNLRRLFAAFKFGTSF